MDTPTPYVLNQTDAIAAAVVDPTRDAPDDKKDDLLDEKRGSDLLDDERESSPSELETGVHAGIANIPFKWRALALVTAITFSSGQECAFSRRCSSCHRRSHLTLFCFMLRDRLRSRPAQEHPAQRARNQQCAVRRD